MAHTTSHVELICAGYSAAFSFAFTSRERKPVSRTHYNRNVWKPALAAGVEGTRENGMHALRHFYASVPLEAGTSIRALAEYLGHADPGFTLRTYTHLMPSSDDRAREAVDAVFRTESPESRGLLAD